jgi:hypothetical protein
MQAYSLAEVSQDELDELNSADKFIEPEALTPRRTERVATFDSKKIARAASEAIHFLIDEVESNVAIAHYVKDTSESNDQHS